MQISKLDALRFDQEIIYGNQAGKSATALTKEQMKAIDRFVATSGFIAAFRYRNRLSLRRPSFKRRPKAT
jgi:hypothetical protein